MPNSRPSTSSSFRVSSQPIRILEIPPYRKYQLNQNPTAIVNPSPPRIPEIPPFKSRKSNDWHPTPVDNSNAEFQQMHQGAGPEWIRRIKNADPSTMHRSIDCIAAQKETASIPTEAAPAKVAPSWSNVAQRNESISSTGGGLSAKHSIDDETKGKPFQFLFFATGKTTLLL